MTSTSLYSGKPKTMSVGRVRAFSGGPFDADLWPKQDIHCDPATAAAAGLPAVAVSGTQYLGHLVELMVDLCGSDWLRSGQLKGVKFVHSVTHGDVITCKAAPDTGGWMRVSVHNQDGQKVLVGFASTG